MVTMDSDKSVTAYFAELPVAPDLISPRNNADVQGPVNLDWESVSSADTYVLQVATDRYFGDSIVIEADGLTYSEYTITCSVL